MRTALADGSGGNKQKNEKSLGFFKKALDLYCLGTVYLGMKNDNKTKGNEMNYEDYMELLSEEIGQSLEIEAMEEAIQTAAKKKYGQELQIKAEIDRKSGEIKLSRVLLVVENVEIAAEQVTIEQGKFIDTVSGLTIFRFFNISSWTFGVAVAVSAIIEMLSPIFSTTCLKFRYSGLKSCPHSEIQ